MRRITGILAVCALALALCACGGASSPYTGTWTAVKAGMGESLQFEASEIFADAFTIEIKGDGTCTVNYGGESGSASWSVDDSGAITISDGEIEMTGTITETAMYLDLEDGVNVTFQKEGAAASDQEAGDAEEETSEEAEASAQEAAEDIEAETEAPSEEAAS